MIELIGLEQNQLLAKDIARLSQASLSFPKITKFTNSELKVTIKKDVKNKHCFIISSIHNPVNDAFVKILFTADALKREGASKIEAIIPYFGYARQNIQHDRGESVAYEVIVKSLLSVGIEKIYSIDIHSLEAAKKAPIEFVNLSAMSPLAQKIQTYLINQNIAINENNVVVVSPDKGGVERATLFAKFFFGKDDVIIAEIKKNRHREQINVIETQALNGDVGGKVTILVDDIVLSGATLIEATKLLLKNGADKVFAVVVHRDNHEGLDRIDKSPILKCFTTNSISDDLVNVSDKFVEISVSRLIANIFTQAKS